jgi:hypothetical protein
MNRARNIMRQEWQKKQKVYKFAKDTYQDFNALKNVFLQSVSTSIIQWKEKANNIGKDVTLNTKSEVWVRSGVEFILHKSYLRKEFCRKDLDNIWKNFHKSKIEITNTFQNQLKNKISYPILSKESEDLRYAMVYALKNFETRTVGEIYLWANERSIIGSISFSDPSDRTKWNSSGFPTTHWGDQS